MADTTTDAAEAIVAARHRGWKHSLLATPVKNAAIRFERLGDDGVMISVQRKKPRYLIPPISWLIKINMTRRIQLDRLGLFIWESCDGEHDVESIVDAFARRYRLTFHEARVSVTSYIKDLVQRGALVLVIDKEDLAA